MENPGHFSVEINIGAITRAIGRLKKGIKNEDTQPGLTGLRDTLTNMRDKLSSGAARPVAA